jgi:DNA-binding response OmpR family regulator
VSTILIVEDDEELAGLLEEFLIGHGFSIVSERRGDRAVERIMAERPALVLLDVMLPGMSGFDVCRSLRPQYTGGILMLTASKAEVDQAVGLELGADDYVVKPFEPRRIRSLLRRLDGSVIATAMPRDVTLGNLAVSSQSREARVDGNLVILTAAEFDVLWLLARRAGEVISREELYQQIRGIPYDGLDRGMDVHVSRLRHKLEAGGYDAAALKSIRGMGYLLVKR